MGEVFNFESQEQTSPAADPVSPIQAVTGDVVNAPETESDKGDMTMPRQEASQEESPHPEEVPSAAGQAVEEKIYLQKDLDEELKRLRDELTRDFESQKKSLKDEVDEYKGKAKEAKEGKETAEKDSADVETFREEAYSLFGDGSPAKLYSLVKAYSVEKLKANKKTAECDALGKEKDTLLRQKEKCEADYKTLCEKHQDVTEECKNLKAQNEELNKNQETLKGDLKSKDDDLKRCRGELEAWCDVFGRLRNAIIPSCLKEKDWFGGTRSDLGNLVCEDPPSDAALLLIASLSDFAVMERNPAMPYFDWKKQLGDIGLAVANFLHHKGLPEGEVIKYLRSFAQAFRDSQIVSKMGISVKVPDLGPGFNTDEVRHLKRGTAVAKVINWCVIDQNGVYSKAVVE